VPAPFPFGTRLQDLEALVDDAEKILRVHQGRLHGKHDGNHMRRAHLAQG